MSGSFESARRNACVHRLDLGLYSRPKEFWENGVRTHVNSMGKIPSTGKILLRGLNLRRCIRQDSKPNTLPTSYSAPYRQTDRQSDRQAGRQADRIAARRNCSYKDYHQFSVESKQRTDQPGSFSNQCQHHKYSVPMRRCLRQCRKLRIACRSSQGYSRPCTGSRI